VRLSFYLIDPEIKLILSLYGLAILLAIFGISLSVFLIRRDRKKK
jgi:hypothetical protein